MVCSMPCEDVWDAAIGDTIPQEDPVSRSVSVLDVWFVLFILWLRRKLFGVFVVLAMASVCALAVQVFINYSTLTVITTQGEAVPEQQ